MSRKKHKHHKTKRKHDDVKKIDTVEKTKGSVQVLYYIDEYGNRIRVKRKRGLYYILRRLWREHNYSARLRAVGVKVIATLLKPWHGAVAGMRDFSVLSVLSPLRRSLHRMGGATRALLIRCTHRVGLVYRDGAAMIVRWFGLVGKSVLWCAVAPQRLWVSLVAKVRMPYAYVQALWQRRHKGATASVRESSSDKHREHADQVREKCSLMRRFFVGFVALLRGIFLGLVDVAILVAIALVIIFVYVWQTIPNAATMLAPNKIAETTQIYDRTGTVVLYEIHGEENRKKIAHDAIPDYMRLATIAAEDDAFYSHFGIDPFSIARAIKENLLRKTLAQGGSTITQQLARNVFFTRKKTLQRKVREAVMAIKLEQAYTKDEILDAYLNVVPYGSNAYGIEAAAEIYFNKHAKDLTLDEAALLASLPKATATFSPYGTHTNRLIARQKMILERMRELGFADGDSVDRALETDTLAKVRPFRQKIIAPHFVFFVIEELEKRYDRDFVRRGGLKVYTTIDLNLQDIAQDVVTRGVARNVRYGAENAALSAVDPRTGAILVMVGSKDYYAKDIDGQVNVATRLRQPGSSFKPFAYATAFAKGYQPETVVWDVLTDFGPDGSGKRYMPQNYTGQFHGLVSLRNALAQSLNVPAVKALYLAGIDATIDTAQRMGITTLTDRSRYGLALVLGGAEVRPLDMAAAFGVFAHDGVRTPAHAIAKITNSNGAVIYDARDALRQQRVLDREVTRKINSILSDNTARTPAFGRNNPLVVPGHTVAAKTGTTQNYRDAWTVGYTPEIAVSVWAGNNDNRPMRAGAAGAYVAAPMWQDFMRRVLADRPDVLFQNYVRVKTTVPMVDGIARPQHYVVGEKRIVGKKYKKKKKEEVRVIYHSILYYIDKDHPLTSTGPNRYDPMLPRWEASLRGVQKKALKKK